MERWLRKELCDPGNYIYGGCERRCTTRAIRDMGVTGQLRTSKWFRIRFIETLCLAGLWRSHNAAGSIDCMPEDEHSDHTSLHDIVL